MVKCEYQFIQLNMIKISQDRVGTGLRQEGRF